MTPIERIIIEVASKHSVDWYLAIACASAESHLDPHANGDFVSGEPTSFGLYQLHRGGELGSLTREQAYDPRTNADVALTEISRVARLHPAWTPGRIAAAAQRPANQGAYADRVDALYGALVGPHFTRLFRYLRLTTTWQVGPDVAALQMQVGGTSIDGVFGPDTLAHVQQAQHHAGIADDGIVGPITCHAFGWRWAG